MRTRAKDLPEHLRTLMPPDARGRRLWVNLSAPWGPTAGWGKVCHAGRHWTPLEGLVVHSSGLMGRDTICYRCKGIVNARRRSDPAYRESERERDRDRHSKNTNAGTCRHCGGPCYGLRDRCRPCTDARQPGGYSLGVLVQHPEVALAPGRLYLVRLPFGLKYGITRADGAREREKGYRSGVVVRQVETATLFEAWAVEQGIKVRQDLHRPTTAEEMEGASGRTEVLWDTPEAEALVHRAMDALEGRQEALLDLAFELALATYEEAALEYHLDRWGSDA